MYPELICYLNSFYSHFSRRSQGRMMYLTRSYSVIYLLPFFFFLFILVGLLSFSILSFPLLSMKFDCFELVDHWFFRTLKLDQSHSLLMTMIWITIVMMVLKMMILMMTMTCLILPVQYVIMVVIFCGMLICCPTLVLTVVFHNI